MLTYIVDLDYYCNYNVVVVSYFDVIGSENILPYELLSLMKLTPLL